MRIPLFRIWYSTTYTTLFTLLLLLLAISPSDLIYQSIRTRELQKLFVVGGVYLLTLLIVLLVYSTRIYTNKSVLAGIPKPYVPVEEEEVGGRVRRMVRRELRRCGGIAWESWPRDVRGEREHNAGDDAGEEKGEEETRSPTEPKGSDQHHAAPKDAPLHEKKPHTHTHTNHHHAPHSTRLLPLNTVQPPWGHISHPGYSPPTSSHPLLPYPPIIAELPNLIEAKAVSLSPPDPLFPSFAGVNDTTPSLPDASIVALLKRPRHLGLREYLAHLSGLGVISPPYRASDFLSHYNYARFSTNPLSENRFAALMASFAALINSMTTPDAAAVTAIRERGVAEGSRGRSLAPTQRSATSRSSSSHASYAAPPPRRTVSQRSGTSSSSPPSAYASESGLGSDTGSVIYHAPASPSSRSPSLAPSMELPISEAEEVSLRSARSASLVVSMQSGQSVIRLRRDVRVGEVPYEIGWDGG